MTSSRPPTAQEWIAQNAPAPPGGPVPPLPFLLPAPATNGAPSANSARRSPTLAMEQLYGPGAEGLLADVVDNPVFSQEHQALALGILSSDVDPKKLTQEEAKLYDEIAHQLAGTTPSGFKAPPVKSGRIKEASFLSSQEEAEDYTDRELGGPDIWE